MKYDVLEPVGARVTDISVDSVTGDDVIELKRILSEHGVVVMPEQYVDDMAFLAFLQAFGELMFTTGETPVDGFPDLNVISNVGRTSPPKSNFHVDTSYVRYPPAYTALRAVEVPAQGGQTQFSNQYSAYDSLPADIREKFSDAVVTHIVTGLELGEDEETTADHPLFQTHPISGRTALYLSAPARCAAITGVQPEETRATVDYLVEHSTREDNLLRHSWSPGDVVMWDNRCVMHRADHSGVVGDRVMHRGMVSSR